MRKRAQYKKPKFQSKLPTLIIMSICLFLILVFGKDICWNIAGLFAPQVPVTDEQAVVAVQDGPGSIQPQKAAEKADKPAPAKTGSVVSQANQSAAQKLLPIIAAPK